jgi:ADP-ribose pyrophosphatase YjhB (NUDIX family)
MSALEPEVKSTWLTDEEIDLYRGRMPLVYVDAVPVRVDDNGVVTHVGLLLRMMPDGTVSRAVVSGRILYNETVRDALLRHLEKDLGPVARPLLPPQASPFTVVEYFPDPSVTGFHDPRQHAVSLAFVVPIFGECAPSSDFLDVAWITPEEALSPLVRAEMTGGQDRLVRMALAYVGRLG